MAIMINQISKRKNKKNESEDLNPNQSSLLSQMAALRIWLVPIVGFVVVLFVSVFVIKPWVEDILEKRELITNRRDQVSQLMAKVNQLSRQDADQLQKYLVSLNLSVPGIASPPVVMATIEQGLNQAGMVIDSVQFKGLSDSQSVELDVVGGSVDLQLTARGEITQISDFLKRIYEASPLVIPLEFSVHDLTSTVVDEETGETAVSKSLNFVAAAPFQLIPEDLGVSATEVEIVSQSDQDLIQSLEELELLLELKDPDSAEDNIESGKSDIF